MNKTTVFIITPLILSVTLLSSACSNNSNMLHSAKSGMYFDTVVSVDLYGISGSKSDSLLNECMSICEKYEKLFNKNLSSSDIAKINSSYAQPVKVDHETVTLICDSLKYCTLSGGRFDITIDPVSKLWDFHGNNTHIPENADLKEACSHVDHSMINIDSSNDTVTLTDPKASIDVGAAAKGYIADRIADYLSDSGVTGAIINMGGDMHLIGSKPDNSLFNIGINDPSSNGCIMSLYLSDMSVATSGTYERCFTEHGKTYHHILDPKTGMSADTDITSVTVITSNAIDADCLCTVCILLGSDEALSLIEQTADTEAIIILDDGSIRKSSGADDYIRN